ncbi:MAG: hypothetical protein HY321_09210 [Armatimonadetes bacterium]|nr:hypothetical protein [Armatimonadota bacterium]
MADELAKDDHRSPDGSEAPPALREAGAARAETTPLAVPLSWLVLLGAVLVLRWVGPHWWVGDGRLRMALHLGALAAGAASGIRLGARAEVPRRPWPPPGTRFQRRTRDLAGQLAFGWWQFLPLAPLLTVCATAVVALVVVGMLQPRELRGIAIAADLLWLAVLSRLFGLILGRMALQPHPEAITDEGVYLSPLAFVPWDRLSHAALDRDGAVVYLHTRRRPWLPLRVVPCGSPEELAEAEGVIAEHLPCFSPAEERPANRRKRRAFLGALAAACVVLATALVALLIMPGLVYVALGGGRALLVFTGSIRDMPELVFLLAVALGEVIAGGLAWLRGAGAATKKPASEGA